MTQPTSLHQVSEKKMGAQYDQDAEFLSSQKATEMVQDKVENAKSKEA